MENWDIWFIGEPLLTRKLIKEKPPKKINIPIFHHSICEAIILASKKSLEYQKVVEITRRLF
jgi:hypothetical protein